MPIRKRLQYETTKVDFDPLTVDTAILHFHTTDSTDCSFVVSLKILEHLRSEIDAVLPRSQGEELQKNKP